MLARTQRGANAAPVRQPQSDVQCTQSVLADHRPEQPEARVAVVQLPAEPDVGQVIASTTVVHDVVQCKWPKLVGSRPERPGAQVIVVRIRAEPDEMQVIASAAAVAALESVQGIQQLPALSAPPTPPRMCECNPRCTQQYECEGCGWDNGCFQAVECHEARCDRYLERFTSQKCQCREERYDREVGRNMCDCSGGGVPQNHGLANKC